jgi:hypothetical protein
VAWARTVWKKPQRRTGLPGPTATDLVAKYFNYHLRLRLRESTSGG